MSGGRFNNVQYQLSDVIENIEQEIIESLEFSDETITEFKNAIDHIKKAQIYMQRIDWFLSGDDSEEVFHTRLKYDLRNIH